LADQLFLIVGIGLNGLRNLSRDVILLLQSMDKIFLENYTNFTDIQIEEFNNILNNQIKPVGRESLENESKKFLTEQKSSRTALLISGDPFMATTHYMLFLEVISLNLRVEIHNNISIFSLAPSLTGLSAYKFGKVVTLPFKERIDSETPYKVIKENLSIGAHTIVLLDINVPNKKFVSVTQALNRLLELEERKNENIINQHSIVIGLSKIGTNNSKIHAGTIPNVSMIPWNQYDPPQALIVCSTLSITEEEALKAFWMENAIHPPIQLPISRILVTGTFDILHPGHLAFFAKARSLKIPSKLWVVVARDSSVQQFKKRKPILSENYRLEMLNALKIVDHAILGNEDTDKIKIIEEIRPDIIAIGFDQWINPKYLQDELRKRGLHTKVVQLEKYGSNDESSSTDIRKKIISSIRNEKKSHL
jgi:diphthine synthase